MSLYDKEELPIGDQLNSVPTAVLYPSRYDKRKHIQINRIDGTNDVVVQIWDNYAEDTRKPESQIRMSEDEANVLFQVITERLMFKYDKRGRDGSDLIVEAYNQ